MGLGERKKKKTTSVEDFTDPERMDDPDEEGEPQKHYGKPRPYDPTFRGPIRNRSCTDAVCCLVFAAFLLGVGAVAVFAFLYGNPDTLIYPSDYRGQICGVTQPVADKPYVFYFDWLACLSTTTLVTLSCPTPQVCVEKCPDESFSVVDKYLTGAIDLSKVVWEDFICLYDVDPRAFVGNDPNKMFTLVSEELCATYYLPLYQFAGRCIPVQIADSGGKTDNDRNVTQEEVNNLRAVVDFVYGIELIENLVDDFLNTWPLILAGLGFALFACVFLLIAMQWLASLVVWIMIILFAGLVAFGNYYCYSRYFRYVNSNQCGNIGDSGFDYLDINCYLQSPNVWLAFSIILSVVGAVLLLLILALFQRIRIATSLLEEASCALGVMSTTFLAPVVPFLLQIAHGVFWAFVMVFLASSGNATYQIADVPAEWTTGVVNGTAGIVNGSLCDKGTFDAVALSPAKCQFVSLDTPAYRLYFQIYMVFGLFWMVNFIIAFGEMSVAGAFASYYWAFSKPADIPTIPILSSIWRALRYHLGSLAFGSLIVTIIQIIRVMLEYAESKIKGCGPANAVAKFMLCCCQCFFWCLEKFIRFINRNAYIEIAVYGRSFCRAARDAFCLLMRNILRVAVLNSITSFMLFVFKLTVTLGMAVGSFYFFTWDNNPLLDGSKPLNYVWAPILAIAVFTYVIAAVTFGVYDMGVDTLFLCFLEDLERNDGSPEKPYYMPSSLMAILGKRNRKEKQDKKGKTDKNDKKAKKAEKGERKKGKQNQNVEMENA